jgi:hypothetical protein
MTKEELYYSSLLHNSGLITIGVSLLTVIIGIIRKRLFDKIILQFLYYLILILVLDASFWLFIWAVNNYTNFFLPFLNKFKIQNTFFLSILVYLTGIYFLGIFFSRIHNSNLIKRLMYLYIPIAIGIYLFIDGYQEYGRVNDLLLKFFVIGLSLWYLKKAFATNLNRTFFRNYYALICLGLFLPNIFQLLFSLFANNLDKTNFVLYVKLKIATNFIDFIGYFLYGWVFLKAKNLKFLERN